MTQSAFNNSAVTRSTASGSYTVGQDCSLTLSFGSALPNSTSSNFVAPTSFRVLMTDSNTGQLSLQTEAGNTLTGSFVAQ